jgi:membrane-bound metal-dependent hydrolase YbcI (DUF457 family)
VHLQTHFLSGWCIGNLFQLNGRERLFCALAAVLPDFDGLGIIFSQDLYWKFHHLLGHNLLFAVVTAGVFCCFSEHKAKMAGLCFALSQLHMVMDLFGSGQLWTISYLWPFSNREFSISCGWALYSWQNILAGVLLIAWTVLIIKYKRRTPLEVLMPKLDRQLVELFNRGRNQ